MAVKFYVNLISIIFVYGTLKEDMLEKVMPHVKPYLQFGDTGFVRGKLFDLGDFPGAKSARLNNKKVFGQLVSIKPGYENKVLQELDKYEEFNPAEIQESLFIRQKVKVFIEHLNAVNAWIYWYNQPVKACKEIADGVYKLEN